MPLWVIEKSVRKPSGRWGKWEFEIAHGYDQRIAKIVCTLENDRAQMRAKHFKRKVTERYRLMPYERTDR